MKYFIKVIKSHNRTDYNRTVEIYTQNKDGSFRFVASGSFIVGCSAGEYAEACKVLVNEFGYKWNREDKYYTLQRKDIKLIFFP